MDIWCLVLQVVAWAYLAIVVAGMILLFTYCADIDLSYYWKLFTLTVKELVRSEYW